MDKRLLILMAASIALSAGFFAYRKYVYKHEGIHYTIRPRQAIHAGDSIAYNDETPGATRSKWDFGDGEFSADASGAHTYLNSGTYALVHTVYGPFGSIRRVDTVNVLGGDIAKKPDAGIIGPEMATVGTPANYAAGTVAKSYEWSVAGDAALSAHVQKTATASFSFTKPGTKTVVLTTKSPDAVIRKDVVVADAAPKPAPPKPIAAAPKPIAMPPAKPAAHAPANHPKPAHSGGEQLEDLGNGQEIKK